MKFVWELVVPSEFLDNFVVCVCVLWWNFEELFLFFCGDLDVSKPI